MKEQRSARRGAAFVCLDVLRISLRLIEGTGAAWSMKG